MHVVDYVGLKKCDLSEFYQDAKEAILVNAPAPRDKEVEMIYHFQSYITISLRRVIVQSFIGMLRRLYL